MKTDLKWLLLVIYFLPALPSFGQVQPYLAANGTHLGLMNEAHEVVHPPDYLTIYRYEDGYWVKKDTTGGGVGYLSYMGKTIIPCQYQDLKKWFNTKAFWIQKKRLWGVADAKSGKVLYTPQLYRIDSKRSQGAYVENMKGMKGILKPDGTFLIPMIYRDLQKSNKGLLLARNQSGKYGYINQQGKTSIPFVYADAHPFRKNEAKVTKDNKQWFTIDTLGHKITNILLPPPYPEKEYEPSVRFTLRGGVNALPVFYKDYGVKKYPSKTKSGSKQDYVEPDYQAYAQQLMNRFVIDSLRFPRKARRKKVQGKVKLQYVITKKGLLRRIKVLQGLKYQCNEEAIRILMAVPKWRPARHVSSVASVNTIEINFDYTQYDRKGRRRKR